MNLGCVGVLWQWMRRIHPLVFILLHRNNQARILVLCNSLPSYLHRERNSWGGWHLKQELLIATCTADGLGLWISSKCENEILCVGPGLPGAKLVNPCCFTTGPRLRWPGYFGCGQRLGTTTCNKDGGKRGLRKFASSADPCFISKFSIKTLHSPYYEWGPSAGA